MKPMWMILASLAAVALVTVCFVLQQRFARRRAAAKPLPPLCTTDDHVASPTLPAPGQVLSRDALVNRDRTLNVHAWDDTPDSGPEVDLSGVEVDVETEPRLIDRSFLTERRRPPQG